MVENDASSSPMPNTLEEFEVRIIEHCFSLRSFADTLRTGPVHHESCPICLDPLTTDLTITKCGHMFHSSCLERHHITQHRCPICRAGTDLSTCVKVRSGIPGGSVNEESGGGGAAERLMGIVQDFENCTNGGDITGILTICEREGGNQRSANDSGITASSTNSEGDVGNVGNVRIMEQGDSRTVGGKVVAGVLLFVFLLWRCWRRRC